MEAGGDIVVVQDNPSIHGSSRGKNRSAKGRRRRAAADQRRLEEERRGQWLVAEDEEEYHNEVGGMNMQAPNRSHRRKNRKNKRRNSNSSSSVHFYSDIEDHDDEDEEEELDLQLALAVSLSLTDTRSQPQGPMDLSYENLSQLEDVKCVVPEAFLESLTVIHYDPSLEMDDVCAICLHEYVEKDEIVKLPCTHGFHKACAYEWLLNYSKNCPTCKFDVVSNSST